MNVIDYLHLNTMIPKITLEAKIHKDEQKVFHYLLTTMETPCKVHIFCPYVFQNILGLAQEHFEITHEHVVLGNKQVITTLCNLTTKKIITKVTPTKIALEHLNMNVIDYLHLNTMIPKITLEAKIHKEEQKVFHYLLTTIETPMKLHVFFPYLFQNILSMTQEHIEVTHEHIVLGNKQVIT